MFSKKFALVILVMLLLRLYQLSGCDSQNSAATATPTQPAISGGVPSEGEMAATPRGASPSPSVLPSLPYSTLTADETFSPAYDIFIGFNMGNRPCNYDTAGDFSRLAWVSSFYNVRFSAPPGSWSGTTPFESELIGENETLSELADYAYCWTWESDEKYDCFVTEGPNPFAASLSVYVPFAENQEWEQRWMTVAPLTADPLDQGQDVYLEYEISYPDGAAPEKRIIIRGGDGHLGDCDMFGGPNVWLPHPIFPLSWQRILKGEEFIKEFVGSVEDYEYWGDVPGLKWTVHFVPAGNR